MKKASLAEIQALHALFCELVPECKCILNMYREHEWWLWLKWQPDQPFTEMDLKAVVAYRRKLIASGNQFQASLKFSHLIGHPEFFEEDLSMARSHRPRTDRDRVLEATGRPAQQEKPYKMAAPLVQAALNRLRESVQ